MAENDEQQQEFDLFGNPIDPPPERRSAIESPERILEKVRSGKVAQTREEFLGIPRQDGGDGAPPPQDPAPSPPPPEAGAAEPPGAEQAPPPARPEQESRELVVSDDKVSIPDLPVTDADVDRFLQSIVTNQYFGESVERGPLKVKFRVKSATEVAWIRRAISRMVYDTGELRTRDDVNQAVLRINLMFQVVEFCGKVVDTPIVPGPPPWKDEELDLDAQFWRSEFGRMNEATLFMVQAMMVQFERKVEAIERILVDPKYSPGGGRS